MIQISQLCYERSDEPILKNINFKVNAGEALQIVGANGSGKTTLLRILAGLLVETSGEIYWQGNLRHAYSPQFLAELSFMGHQTAIKEELTTLENLAFFAALTKNKKQNCLPHEEIISLLNLTGSEHKLAKELSAGQKRRLALARLLLSNTKLWILDEPFTALDQMGIQFIEKIIADFLSQGGIVILTSHQAFKLKNISQRIFHLMK
jgi:heme exporter protein A